MTSSDLSSGDLQQTTREVVRLHSGLFMAQGAIMTILGVLAVVWPQLSSLAVDIYLGWAFLLSGAFALLTMFMTRGSFLWPLLTGALSLLVGVLLLWHPVQGVVTLTLVLVAFFIAEGVVQAAAAIAVRQAFPQSWAWMLLSGVADLVLAYLIIQGWPGSAAWALGLIVGVNLMTSGIAMFVVAASVRRLARDG